MWIIWKNLFLYSMKEWLDLCKSLFDVELIYSSSILDNCDNLHLLRSYWSNMAHIHVFHINVILFLLLISYIYFGMYFLSNVSTIYTFPSAVFAQKNPPCAIGNIISLWSFCTDIWSRCSCFYTKIPSILTNNESDTSEECITWGLFLSRHIIYW